MRIALKLLLLIGCVGLAGCTSPETRRSRGSGPGADVGNRPAQVKMHEGSDPYWKTPDRIVGEHPPLESARQAERRSQ
jgi:hypothetical protein